MRHHASPVRRPRPSDNGAELRFQELYHRFFGRLVTDLRRRVPSRAIAEDLAQETLVRAFVKLDLYDPARPLWPWIRAISRHTLADHAPELGREIPTFPREAAATGDELAAIEDRTILSAALRRLTPRHRAALGIRYVEDREPVEAADRLGISPSAFNQLLFRARIRLREEYRRLTDGIPAVAGARALLRRAARRAYRTFSDAGTSRLADPFTKTAGVALGLALAISPVSPAGDASARARPTPREAGRDAPLEALPHRPADTEPDPERASSRPAPEEQTGGESGGEARPGNEPEAPAQDDEDTPPAPGGSPGGGPLSGPAEAPESVTQPEPEPVATDAEVRPIAPVPPVLAGDPDPEDPLPQVVCDPCP